MIAAEKGDLNAVKYFLKHKADETFEVDRKIAIDLVDPNSEHYSDIVMSLLQENSRFPKNFERENISDDLKAFVNKMEEMHKAIKDGKVEEVRRIIEKNPNLRYFFVPSRKYISTSAYKTAEKCNQTEIRRLFKDNAILKASFEMGRHRSASDGMSTLMKLKKSLPLKRGFSTPSYARKDSKDIEGTPLQPIKENAGEGEKDKQESEQIPQENEEDNIQQDSSNEKSQSNSDKSNPNKSQSDGDDEKNNNNKNFWGNVKNFVTAPVSFFAKRHRKEQDRRNVSI